MKDTKLNSGSDGIPKSVEWYDTYDRGEFNQLFVSIGARPSFVNSEGLSQPSGDIAKSLFLVRDTGNRTSDLALQISHAVSKVLKRGELPFSTLLVEQSIYNHIDMSDFVKPIAKESSEVGYETDKIVSDDTINSWLLNTLCKAEVDKKEYPPNVFDSPRDHKFLTKWVSEKLGDAAHKLFSPQVPIDLLMQNSGISSETERRGDFLLNIPGASPVLIEIDGEDHKDKIEQDKARDRELNSIGIEVIRIPNAEVDAGDGPALNSLKARFIGSRPKKQISSEEIKLAEAVGLATDAARLQASLMMALKAGIVEVEDTWNINVDADRLPKPIIKAALADLSAMINSYMELFAPEIVKPKLKLVTAASKANISVSLKTNETHSSIFPHLSNHDVIVCQAPIPVTFTCALDPPRVKPKLKLNNQKAKPPLTVFLQTLFRKRSFRDLQSEAVCNVLRGADTVTLLPTGAGKSIIYQLAGMLLPGVTIVIDPIVALIEDQELGLRNNGISRVAGLLRTNQVGKDELESLLKGMSQGDFLYLLMSPERMLIPSFRDALKSMMRNTFVSLAVIDEAHCVSQWGHSFRFAYLQLAKNLRLHCSSIDTGPPTILALTGTASRTVLKELVAEVGISTDDEDSIIRPEKFDRPELTFSIKRIDRGGDTFPELAASLEELPEIFGADIETFYDPNGKKTNSGIIFSPFVRGRTHGLAAIRDEAAKKVLNTPGIFGGRTPTDDYTKSDWEAEKRKHAEAFKENTSPLLVATSAFGMGIDKPNIRWTLHMGLPSSIEAFYQEAGRAGRDKQKSHCMLLFSEVDSKATDEVLEAESFEDLGRRAEKINKNKDDISRALFFHLQSFASKADELEVVDKIMSFSENKLKKDNLIITYEDEDARKRIERGLIRMSQAGILEDYSHDYPGKTLYVSTRDFILEDCRSHVLSYVKKVQPSMLKKTKTILGELESIEEDKQPRALCEFLIEFTYDTIEKSRRRMLLEAVQLARRCDDDAAIRQSLMDYLQEGMDTTRVTELAESEEIDFEEWLNLIDDVSDNSEARELRGISIRLLESYPDHAGLLSLRALTEALSGNGDEKLVRDSLNASFKSALENHLCAEDDLNNLVHSLLDLSGDELPNIRRTIVEILNSEGAGIFKPDSSVYEHLARVSKNWGDDERAAAIQVITIDALNRIVPMAQSKIDQRQKALVTLRGD